MSGQRKLNSDQVMQIASNLESLNTKLLEELKASKATVDGLSSVWTGEAANATRDSYNEFATKYFEAYHEIINQYVSFLRTAVVAGGESVEMTNISLSQNFK